MAVDNCTQAELQRQLAELNAAKGALEAVMREQAEVYGQMGKQAKMLADQLADTVSRVLELEETLQVGYCQLRAGRHCWQDCSGVLESSTPEANTSLPAARPHETWYGP